MLTQNHEHPVSDDLPLGTVLCCLVQVEVGDVCDDFYCVQCEVHRPPRCHHCSKCQECVMLMDHHWCVIWCATLKLRIYVISFILGFYVVFAFF